MTNEIVKQDAKEVQAVSGYEAFRDQCAEACINAMLDAARKGKPENIIRLSGFVAVRDMPLPEVMNDAEAMRKDNENLNAEVLKLHRELAAEKLRADQGWARYESANRMLMSANVEIMQMKGGAA